MRVPLLAAALVLLGLPMAPPAAACHPALDAEVPVPGVATVGLGYDHGCPHEAVPGVCARVAWEAIPAPPTGACIPVA